MPKFVVSRSRTLTDVAWSGTTVLTDVASGVRAFKDRFGELHVIGSGDLVKSLLSLLFNLLGAFRPVVRLL